MLVLYKMLKPSIEVIIIIYIIGEILKRIDDYKKGRRFQDERKRRNEEEGILQEEKRRKQECEYNKKREEIKEIL